MANPLAIDLALAERARKALSSSPFHALRALCVEAVDGQLVISGRVASYFHKQLAQEAVRSVAGKHLVKNLIDVD